MNENGLGVPRTTRGASPGFPRTSVRRCAATRHASLGRARSRSDYAAGHWGRARMYQHAPHACQLALTGLPNGSGATLRGSPALPIQHSGCCSSRRFRLRRRLSLARMSQSLLVGPANFFPLHAPDIELHDGNTQHTFLVGDLVVPLVVFDQAKPSNFLSDLRTGEDGEPDETGRALWPCSTLVVSILLRCQSLLGSVDVLELGSGSAFCGLVACQMARRWPNWPTQTDRPELTEIHSN